MSYFCLEGAKVSKEMKETLEDSNVGVYRIVAHAVVLLSHRLANIRKLGAVDAPAFDALPDEEAATEDLSYVN